MYIFLAMLGLRCCAWAFSGCGERGYSSLPCAGLSLRWFLLLRSTGSRHTGFSSCGTQAQLLCGMWDLPGPGLEPVSPALAGGFLTTVPPEKPYLQVILCHFTYSVRTLQWYTFISLILTLVIVHFTYSCYKLQNTLLLFLLQTVVF